MIKKDYTAIFSNALKYYMERDRKTQKDLCDELGFDKSMVSTWVRGVHIPRMDKIDKLAKYFNCSRESFMGWGEEKDMSVSMEEERFINEFRKLDDNHKQRLAEIMRFYLSEQKEE